MARYTIGQLGAEYVAALRGEDPPGPDQLTGRNRRLATSSTIDHTLGANGFLVAVYRNPEKLARAWELQRADRERFVRFFGSDLVVVPGEQVQDRLDQYWAFCREEVSRSATSARRRSGEDVQPLFELPPELIEAETVALIYDEVDGWASTPSSA